MSAAAPPITAADEQPHAPGSELAWRESHAFDLYDERSGLGGVTRMTVRPNEGTMEVALSFFLPDGGFIAARHVKAQTTNTAALEVEGMAFALEEPLRRWRVTYDGPAHSLASARDADQRAAWARSRLERLIVELVLEAPAPPLAGGCGSFEQICVAHGEVWVSGDRYDVRALGGRERSWGVDEAATLRSRRSFSARFAEDCGFRAVLALRDGDAVQHGWILRDGIAPALEGVTVATTTEPGTYLHESVRLTLTDEQAVRHEVAGEVLHVAPLPETRNGRASVLCEGVARFVWRGRVGYGFASYWHALDAAGALAVPLT
ncbi:MAG: hypothetical protein AB1689_16915 [Thermodesulfobacteriota bacterium]